MVEQPNSRSRSLKSTCIHQTWWMRSQCWVVNKIYWILSDELLWYNPYFRLQFLKSENFGSKLRDNLLASLKNICSMLLVFGSPFSGSTIKCWLLFYSWLLLVYLDYLESLIADKCSKSIIVSNKGKLVVRFPGLIVDLVLDISGKVLLLLE